MKKFSSSDLRSSTSTLPLLLFLSTLSISQQFCLSPPSASGKEQGGHEPMKIHD